MERPAGDIDVVSPRPVVWPPNALHERMVAWIHRLGVSPDGFWGSAPPGELASVLERLRIAPWSRPSGHHRPGGVGLWWHEVPDRLPVILERLDPAEIPLWAGEVRAHAEGFFDGVHGGRGHAAPWLLGIADQARHVVRIDGVAGGLWVGCRQGGGVPRGARRRGFLVRTGGGAREGPPRLRACLD